MRRSDPLPTSYPQGNTHRIVLHRPDDAQEFSRIEDILGDGLRRLRRAMSIDELPTEAGLMLEPCARRVRELVVSKRRLLSDDARHHVGTHLAAARRWAGEHGSTPALDRLVEDLAAALEASEWVADLIAAEREIAWHRNAAAPCARK